jgi:hypothetical protein
MTEPRHAVLEVVEFLATSGRWPAGTTGTVEADDQRALVEITDDRGHADRSAPKAVAGRVPPALSLRTRTSTDRREPGRCSFARRRAVRRLVD